MALDTGYVHLSFSKGQAAAILVFCASNVHTSLIITLTYCIMNITFKREKNHEFTKKSPEKAVKGKSEA